MYFSLCPRMHLFYRVRSDLELGSVWLWRLIRLGMNKVIFCQLITNVLYSLFVYGLCTYKRTSTIHYFYSRGLTCTLQQGGISEKIKENKKQFFCSTPCTFFDRQYRNRITLLLLSLFWWKQLQTVTIARYKLSFQGKISFSSKEWKTGVFLA